METEMEHQPTPERPANPYSAPQSPYSKSHLGPRVRFDAISDAWRILGTARGTWALMILLFIGIVAGIVFASMILQVAILVALGGGAGAQGEASTTALIVSNLVMFVLMVVMFCVECYLLAGLFRAACKHVRGEPIRVGDLFSAGDVFGSFFLGTILYALCVCAGTLLCILPGLLVAGRLMLMFPLIADRRMTAVEAMSTSWRTLAGQTWMSAIFFFVVSFLAGIGIYLCGIGILFSAPLQYLGAAVVYRDYFQAKPAAQPWAEPI
jgi:uncharacterized membrane protein